MRATIVDPGQPGQPYGEPVAELENGRTMPMGWNRGQCIPIGTTGEAKYISTSHAGLWQFTPDEKEEPC